MRTRVEQLVGDDCRQIWLSTFHSLCARLLRREAPAIGLSRDFVIYDSSDQLSVVKQAMKALDIDDKMIQPRAALARISQAKNRMEIARGDARHRLEPARPADRARSTRPTCARSPTPARSISTTCCSRPSICSRPASGSATSYAHKFKYVLVDEYQDTNRPQYLLIRRLGRAAPQSVRRRRPGSVDLPLARRGPAQHPRLRARFSRRARSSSSSRTTDRRR